MLSETLSAGLEQYKIGPKIRALRLNKKLGQQQLGAHTGLSPALLSKIERGQLFPTLPTLLRIAMVFGVGLDYFFVDTRKQPAIAVTRKKDRLRLPDRPGRSTAYFFESLDFPVTDRKMNAYFAEFPAPPHPSEPHVHEGAELVYAMRGQMIVSVDGEDVKLEEGDAVTFDPTAPHRYWSHGRLAASAIIVVVPGPLAAQPAPTPRTHPSGTDSKSKNGRT